MGELKTRQLGKSDLHLTTVGLGTWAMGGGNWAFGWGEQDDAESIRAIHAAIDLGINWIDTAPVYGLSHGEEVVGKALRECTRKPLVATKCGRSWSEQREIRADLSRETILKEAEASLQRLHLERIDLYQIHWPQPDEGIEEAWSAIGELVAAGKVRYGGVCNFDVGQLKRLEGIHPVTSVQPPYSMLVRDAEKELLSYCAEKGIGVVAYSPMQKGLLTDKFSREWAEGLKPDDHRSRDPQFTEPQLSANLQLVERLRAIAGRHGKTVSQLAVAWVLRRPEVTSAIVGARRPDQIRETVRAGEWELSREVAEELEAILAARAKDD